MKMRLLISLFTAVFFLGGCATYKPVPEGYGGPTAAIRDTFEIEGNTKAKIFYLAEVDGNRIDNMQSATRQASTGTGFMLHPRTVVRDVPIRLMRVKIVATHIVGAPIHEFASRAAGTFFDTEAALEFTPKAGQLYAVRGELKKGASRVWLEDDETKEVVVMTPVAKPSR